MISAVSTVIMRVYYFVNPWLEAGSAGVDALEGVEAEATGAFARAAAIIGRESAVVDSERGWAFRTSSLGVVPTDVVHRADIGGWPPNAVWGLRRL